ncbi:hypothetical protein R5W23_005473 [Gemmata sp. JC673]|uniref:Uncharacterized protein n=1 Tax=Gemmata algarum TaxID=2975278 RepID=A0ABU5ET94_9BACT|nr:hypothetical protein [Gemmata algarum]MDY3558380.1 hypothetical protein [Gemmata algarum]
MKTRAHVKWLLGVMSEIPLDADHHAVAESLITELEDDGDDEHYQVAAGYDQWSLTIGTSGMAVLDDLSEIYSESGIAPQSLYLWLPSRAAGVSLLEAMLRGEMETVRRLGWVTEDQLPPQTVQVFRSG